MTKNMMKISKYILESLHNVAQEGKGRILRLEHRVKLQKYEEIAGKLERSILDYTYKLEDNEEEALEKLRNMLETFEKVKLFLNNIIYLVIEAGLIAEDEQDVYLAYLNMKCSRPEGILFNEAIESIAKNTGRDVDKVKQIVLRLIGEGLIIARV